MFRCKTKTWSKKALVLRTYLLKLIYISKPSNKKKINNIIHKLCPQILGTPKLELGCKMIIQEWWYTSLSSHQHVDSSKLQPNKKSMPFSSVDSLFYKWSSPIWVAAITMELTFNAKQVGIRSMSLNNAGGGPQTQNKWRVVDTDSCSCMLWTRKDSPKRIHIVVL